MSFRELAAARYSCKKYDPTPVDPGDLEYVLSCGRLAPTAKNLQEQRVYVLAGRTDLDKVDSITPCRYGAPVVLLVAWDTENVFTYPGGKRDSGAEDASIVATHLMLAAAECGLGSCWVNFFDPAEAKEAFGLPENEEVLMLLDLGHPAADGGPLANHGLRKPLEETVVRR
ncbi:nitroreductase family protein [Olsenella sp. YH-ols2217]|uniref:Nitroreductase family protein n=1 Tax=Kribbibacterium absianum TaxID=3044210 RepID=A0ABT6ZK96_9ACTN|nr:MULTISPECIES: nitroreductase family protein [unclassified Olsenella]MDJ1122590.1 nitroreductase family protein [Olsenella sp. YH-ols2216]MDJ1129450.1 nitroreductase family protein [Olsenella sp. YH-ols2217]